MKIEWLIALYLFVSLMMIVFNFGFLFYEKVRARRFATRTVRMAESLSAEIERNAEFPTAEHKHLLERRMRHLAGMEAFDLTVEHLAALDADKSQRYLSNIGSVFDHLTYHFVKKSDLHKAYFSYVLKRWYRQSPASDTVVQTLLRFVSEGSFYVRQNAFEALAQVGSAHAFIEAVALVERGGDFHHSKLVTEAARVFAGDVQELEAELKERFAGFEPHTQAAIINYFRMSGRGEPEKLQALLENENVSIEVRLACIRYFARNFWEPVGKTLRQFARCDDPSRWEYAAIAATALASYPSAEACDVLKRCLSSASWYVRFNAAKTLFDWGLELDDLADVLQGKDTYARDMLMYRWEIEHLDRKAALPTAAASEGSIVASASAEGGSGA